MKILLVHNYYQSSSPSGEDTVFENEKKLLEDRGVDVVTYTRHNDEILIYNVFEKFKLSFENIWSTKTYNELKMILEKEKPDICHFHNIFYLISPSGYNACKDMGIPVVQTLHNYRFFCINGLLMKDGMVCENCLGSTPWRGAFYGCYRNSRIHSLPLAIMSTIHRLKGTWYNLIDAYIALTDFSRSKFIKAGLPKDRIFVKPNFLLNQAGPSYDSEEYGIFLGRLSKEKGLNTLIDAIKICAMNDIRFSLKIVGDGSLRSDLEGITNIQGMEFLGRQSDDVCTQMLCNSSFMVLPSMCYEGFPLSLGEAYASGKPIIASRLGAMEELIEDGKTGLLFEPGNADDLAAKMQWMFEHKDACTQMGKNARKVFEEKYTAKKNYQMLMNIYETVLNRH